MGYSIWRTGLCQVFAIIFLFRLCNRVMNGQIRWTDRSAKFWPLYSISVSERISHFRGPLRNKSQKGWIYKGAYVIICHACTSLVVCWIAPRPSTRSCVCVGRVNSRKIAMSGSHGWRMPFSSGICTPVRTQWMGATDHPKLYVSNENN